MQYYKFVKWDAVPIENALKSKIPAALVEYDKGNKKPFNEMQIATCDPYYKYGGWCFPLRPYLRRFWVKTKYHGILEYYAVNKTAIRKDLKSNLIEIVEV
jgi:hypothetical protein